MARWLQLASGITYGEEADMAERFDTREVKISLGRNFLLSQWTRSSGRVLSLRSDNNLRQAKNIHLGVYGGDLAKIYRRFLDLKNEDTGELADAVSYGLRLLSDMESVKDKARDAKVRGS